jgi:hypothetical protein
LAIRMGANSSFSLKDGLRKIQSIPMKSSILLSNTFLAMHWSICLNSGNSQDNSNLPKKLAVAEKGQPEGEWDAL